MRQSKDIERPVALFNLKGNTVIPALLAHLQDALDEAQKQPKSREMSLVITKIEEAIHWYSAVKWMHGNPPLGED